MRSERLAQWARAARIGVEALIHVGRGVSMALGEIEVGLEQEEARTSQPLRPLTPQSDPGRFDDELPIHDRGPSFDLPSD